MKPIDNSLLIQHLVYKSTILSQTDSNRHEMCPQTAYSPAKLKLWDTHTCWVSQPHPPWSVHPQRVLTLQICKSGCFNECVCQRCSLQGVRWQVEDTVGENSDWFWGWGCTDCTGWEGQCLRELTGRGRGLGAGTQSLVRGLRNRNFNLWTTWKTLKSLSKECLLKEALSDFGSGWTRQGHFLRKDST